MRGEIQNRARAQQIRDFTGLCWGSITPTDIDGFVEFRDKLFVWIEAKLVGQDMDDGQRKALERACNAIAGTDRMSAILLIEHNEPCDKDIQFATCPVRQWFYKGEWRSPMRPVTCKEAIDKLLQEAGIIL